ncbi:hypothetical protein [Haladaptatus sp. DFWS20]
MIFLQTSTGTGEPMLLVPSFIAAGLTYLVPIYLVVGIVRELRGE